MRAGRTLIVASVAVTLLAACVRPPATPTESSPPPEPSEHAHPPNPGHAHSPVASPEPSAAPTVVVPSVTEAPLASPSSVRSGSPTFVPAPDRPIPTSAKALAAELARVTRALRTSTDDWLQPGHPPAGRPPESLVLQALFEQRIYRTLMRDPGLTNEVLALLPPDARTRARLTVTAMATLIAGVQPVASTAGFRTGPPEPPGALLADFHEAEQRFGVPWEVLAAVMYVESKFGRARSASTAGAQGPMQFLPSTWNQYGMGGNIDDPHDAILGAANFLRANGAPADGRRALYAYNHSDRYVDAVLDLADRLREEPRSYYPLYAWQVFVVTTHGDVQLTGPGSG